MTDTKLTPTPTPYKELLLVEDRGDYAIITINRPEKRNALSVDAVFRFREALAEVSTKKVVILTGVNGSFCAGMDLSDSARQGELAAARSSSDLPPWTAVQKDIRNHRAVFIAAVNGYALGGGSTLVNTCDLAIAGESAKIALPEMGFGGWPMQAGPAAVKRLAPKHAAELILTARRVDAHEALRMALVNKVVPDLELMDEAIALAEQLAGYDEYALDYGKKAIQRMQEMSWDEAMDYGELTSRITRGLSTSAREGMAAFIAGKRGPGQGA